MKALDIFTFPFRLVISLLTGYSGPVHVALFFFTFPFGISTSFRDLKSIFSFLVFILKKFANSEIEHKRCEFRYCAAEHTPRNNTEKSGRAIPVATCPI